MSTVSVLLSQKPDSPPPTIGDTRRFSVEQKEKKNKPGEFWNKAKNEGEGYGEPYKILKADRLEDYTGGEHGTLTQFSLLLEATSTQEGAGVVGGGVHAAPATSDRQYATADFTHKDETIARAVAFKGAVEVWCASHAEASTETDATTAIRSLTAALLPIVKGAADPKDVPLDTAESVQADQEAPPF